MSVCGGSNVHVVVRVRPLSCGAGTEQDGGGGYRWVVTGNQICEVDKQKPYVFDHIFDTSSTTKEVYDKVAFPILLSVMDGYNGTIFAYGQTSSGKTHTMMGNKTNEGVIPRVARSLFECIEKAPTREFLLRVACIEIYNEKVYDLFSKCRKPLNLREDSKGQPFVEGLEWEFVKSFSDLMTIMWKCEGNRSYGATAMNERSSRSHTIFSMIIESRFAHDFLETSEEGAVRVSQLNLVDLAGSERAGQVGSTGNRFKEGCAINSSLFVLGNVINRLTQADGQFINFRDSKLTRILQASLGGNAKTSIICTVTPDQIEETHSTLKFASTAKAMSNKPIVNEVLSDEAVLKQYARQLHDLRSEREALKEKERNQEEIEKELEESNRKNQELEAKIRSLNERIIHSSNSSAIFTNQKSRRETWAGHLKFKSLDPLDLHFRKLSEDFETSNEPIEVTAKKDDIRKKVVRFDSFPQVCTSALLRYEDVGCQTEVRIDLESTFEGIKKENEELESRNRRLVLRRAELSGLLKRKEDVAKSLDRELKELREFAGLEKGIFVEIENELKEAKSKIEFFERTSRDAESLYLDSMKKIGVLTSENQNLKETVIELEATKENLTSRVENQDRIENYETKLIAARKRIAVLENEQKDHEVRFELRNERHEKLVSELKAQLQEAYEQIESRSKQSPVRADEEERDREKTPNEVTELRTEVKELVAENERLLTVVSALESDLRGRTDLKMTVQSAKDEIDRSEIELAALKLRNEELAKELTELRCVNSDESSRDGDISRLEREVKELTARIASLSTENEDLSERNREMTMNGEFGERLARFASQDGDLRFQIESLGSKNVSLTREVKKLNSVNAELTKAVRELELERQRLTVNIEEMRVEHLVSTEEFLRKMQSVCEQKDSRLRTLEAQKREEKEVSEGLLLRVRDLEGNENGCNHEAEMQIVQNEFERRETELKSELEELKKLVDVEVRMKKDVEVLASEHRVWCSSLHESSAKLNDEMATMEKRVMDLDDENRQLKKDLEAAEKLSQKFKGHCDEYHEEYEQNKVTIEGLEKKLFEAESLERETQFNKLKEENERFRKEIADHVHEGYRVSCRQSFDQKKLQSKVESLEEQVQILQQKNDYLKKDLRRIHLQKMETTNLGESRTNPNVVPVPHVEVQVKADDRMVGSTNFTMELLKARNAELERELKCCRESRSLVEEDNRKMDAKLKKLIAHLEASKTKKVAKENILSQEGTKKVNPNSPKSVLTSQNINTKPCLFTGEEVSKLVNEDCKVS